VTSANALSTTVTKSSDTLSPTSLTASRSPSSKTRMESLNQSLREKTLNQGMDHLSKMVDFGRIKPTSSLWAAFTYRRIHKYACPMNGDRLAAWRCWVTVSRTFGSGGVTAARCTFHVIIH